MKPCNDVEETEAQEFTDELTVLANMVGSFVHYLLWPLLFVIIFFVSRTLSINFSSGHFNRH